MVELKIKKDDEEITLMDKEDIEKYSITVEKQSTADTGFFSTYVIKQNDIQKGVKINVPKDFLVKSTTVKTCNTANSPVSGYEVGDKYIDFVINSKDSTDTDEHLYLATKEIGAYPVDEVTLTVYNGKLAIKGNSITWAKLATTVQDIIDEKEIASNKVNSVSASSTNTQYPSAKCVYDTFCQKNDSRLSDARTPTNHTHTKAEISDFPTSMTPTSHTHSVMDLNNYMPKSNNGGGTTGYLKVLNIKTNQAWLDDPITFEIYQRAIDKPIYCSLKFSGGNNTDPTVSSFKSWGSNNEVYIYKASTNNWQVIVKKIDYYDIITVENINCNWGRWNAWATTPSSIFTHLDETITSLPNDTSSNPLIKATYDISDVLTDTDTDRSLSANQGKILKDLVDGKSPNNHNHDSTYIKNTDGTVLNANIGNNQVNNAKLSDNAVSTSKIQNKAVTNDKINPIIFWGGGSDRKSAYLKMIKFKFTSDAQWIDKPITFDLYNRTRKDNIHVSLTFKNVGDNDPDVDYFSYTSYDLVNLYLYKEETSTWSLIIQKESNGNMEIANLTIPNYNSRDVLRYYNMNIQISALPSNTSTNPLIQAIQRTYGGISNNSITAPSFIKNNGTSSQFLKGDGSVETLNTTPCTVTYTDGTTSTINFVTR